MSNTRCTADALADLTDADLVMLIAAEDAVDRSYERNVFATALLNRLNPLAAPGVQ